MTAGTRLGPYEIVSLLGAGGMGEVYRARDARLQREVAIKVLPAGFADDATRRARFERETQAVAALSHSKAIEIMKHAGPPVVQNQISLIVNWRALVK